MRITGGKARGISLISTQDKLLRPATDYLRKALFSSLAAWMKDKIFLDLFSGTGSYGLEALSHGAQSGVFVEKNRELVDILRMNIASVTKSLGKQATLCKIIHQSVWNFKLSEEWKFDVIFLDPPFSLSRTKAEVLLSHALSFLRQGDGKICFELPADFKAP
ncbi:MAG: RsmD family RNA methyltransferase, partial [Puniceicoccales bacterium]|nr:RsmD family RNA methyltransferase [Puniceicoccales bacterium]